MYSELEIQMSEVKQAFGFDKVFWSMAGVIGIQNGDELIFIRRHEGGTWERMVQAATEILDLEAWVSWEALR